jgi:hypothetical protein
MRRILGLLTVVALVVMLTSSALPAAAHTSCGHSTPNELFCSGGTGGGFGVGLGGDGGRFATSNDSSTTTAVGGFGGRGGGSGGYCQRSDDTTTRHGSRFIFC